MGYLSIFIHGNISLVIYSSKQYKYSFKLNEELQINVSGDVNPLECAICYENFNDPHMTKCGHTFCKPCITDWLIKDPSCPSCRKPVKKTNPNLFARQMVEAAAKKVEVFVHPVLAKEEPEAPCIDEVTDSVAVMQIQRQSPVAVKKVVVSPASIDVVAAEVAGLSRVQKAMPDPYGVSIKVFNRMTGQVDSFLMPQAKGNAKAVQEALATKTLPAQAIKDAGARAKVYTLIIEPSINVQDFIKSQGNMAVKIPTKTFTTIHGIEFYDGVTMLSTDRGDMYYRTSDEQREYYLAASHPGALQGVIDKIVMQLLMQPNQLQLQASVSKDMPRHQVLHNLEEGLKKMLQNPQARLADVLQFDSPTEPDKHCYVGITVDRPTKKPEAYEGPGVPITAITTIDKLPEVLKLLGRI